MSVRPKKHLGQHFLTDANIARNIANGLTGESYNQVLEIGPGMGMLTQFLLESENLVHVVEIDSESVSYLKQEYPELENRIIEGDFLKLDLASLFEKPVAIIGNFPYNISSQIVFKTLEHRNLIPEFVGMFQKEVAERICSEIELYRPSHMNIYFAVGDMPSQAVMSSMTQFQTKVVPMIEKHFGKPLAGINPVNMPSPVSLPQAAE